jgi:hypothetical protein
MLGAPKWRAFFDRKAASDSAAPADALHPCAELLFFAHVSTEMVVCHVSKIQLYRNF